MGSQVTDMQRFKGMYALQLERQPAAKSMNKLTPHVRACAHAHTHRAYAHMGPSNTRPP